MSPMDIALNKVAKWRTLLTGWQLGTRGKGDPEGDAVRDHRELSIILRVEVTALITVLIEKGLIKQEEWENACERSARELDRFHEQRFPGVRSTTEGLVMDPREIVRAGWQEGWKP